MTQIKFYRELGGILAVFPEDNQNGNGYRKDLVSCYSAVGQHSVAAPEYIAKLSEAKTNDYMPLLNELMQYAGYRKGLQIMNSQTIQCHRPPTKGEIKFGEGATHYRDFPLSVIGLKKAKAEWKDWFIAPDDGLRYYTR